MKCFSCSIGHYEIYNKKIEQVDKDDVIFIDLICNHCDSVFDEKDAEKLADLFKGDSSEIQDKRS